VATTAKLVALARNAPCLAHKKRAAEQPKREKLLTVLIQCEAGRNDWQLQPRHCTVAGAG